MALTDAERVAMTARLARYEARWDELVLGEAPASVNESNAAGGSGVSFTRADRAGIDTAIREMRVQLGLECLPRHRALRPVVMGLYS